jgi:hypothetical protein
MHFSPAFLTAWPAGHPDPKARRRRVWIPALRGDDNRVRSGKPGSRTRLLVAQEMQDREVEHARVLQKDYGDSLLNPYLFLAGSKD